MNEITLANGKHIRDCLGKVIDLHWEDASYEAYDLLNIGQDNSLTDLDILVANNIRARMDGRAFLAFKRNRPKIEKALHALPVNVAPDDPWPDEQSMRQTIEDAYAACWDEHVGPARITKVLHKKRPQLIPLVDGVVVMGRYYKTYRGPRGGGPGIMGVTQTIGEDMIANTDALRRIQRTLEIREINLTRVRVFDILLWTRYLP